MFRREFLESLLAVGTRTGADYAEVFCERTIRSQLRAVDGKIERSLSGIDSGVGIRLLQGSLCLYASTNSFDEDELVRLMRETASALGDPAGERRISLQQKEFVRRHPVVLLPSEADKRAKALLIQEADAAARAFAPEISRTSGAVVEWESQILIAGSDGRWVEDERVYTRFLAEAVATWNGERQTGFVAPGARQGSEFLRTIDGAALSREAARQAVTMVKARECPAGTMAVVIDSGFGGVIFHEACGHGLEATALARKASVFAGKMGQPIASPVVTAIDDALMPGAWGSLDVDDEGCQTQRNVLIQDGILMSYLVDRHNGNKLGLASTGSARRESYRYAPTSRMNNTYIAAGTDTKDAILRDTPAGLYAKHLGGGSVDPASGSFNFSVLEGYLIRDGQIAEPVRGATLIGKGPEILPLIDRVADNLDFTPGMCGSVSGHIPVLVGQPAIRVERMVVGGKGAE